MKKSELKLIIKEMKYFIKNNEQIDDSLIIIGINGEYQFINELDELPNNKISINNIEVGIFIGSCESGIYLKNGLSSMRKAKKLNLI